MRNKEEQDIIKGCIANDRRSQNELYCRYFAMVSNLALRYVDNENDIKEYINEGFLKVLLNIKNYDSKYALATWIRNIMVRHFIDQFRKKSSQKLEVITIENEDAFEWNDSTLDEIFEADELLEMLKNVPKLSAKVFNLFVVEGYSHKEISDMLEIGVGTSKWHVSNARKFLKKELTKRETKFELEKLG